MTKKYSRPNSFFESVILTCLYFRNQTNPENIPTNVNAFVNDSYHISDFHKTYKCNFYAALFLMIL